MRDEIYYDAKFCDKSGMSYFSCAVIYRIYLAIRQVFPLSRITKNICISLMKLCYNMSFTLPNPKDLDPSHKIDLDFWDSLGRKKLCLIAKEIQ